MSRNENSHFANVPHVTIERSKFTIEHNHKTTGNAADLIPIFLEQDVLPGDTISVRTSLVIRMQTPIFPTMDNCYADIYYFAVPNRLVWNHWKEFMGENTSGAWTQTTEYQVPQYTTPANTETTYGAVEGTIMDYMGIPTGIPGLPFSKLPIRAYNLIWNEWFRDQNLTAPVTISKDDTDSTASNTDAINGGRCHKVYKFHDYFTSALPEPQKGTSVTMPLGTTAPVIGNGMTLGLTDGTLKGGIYEYTGMKAVTGLYGAAVGTANSGTQIAANKGYGVTTEPTKSGIIADLTAATAATISALRLATQTQRMYEKDARGGTRYTEIVRNHFGTTSPDARQQRPEYLGGKRIPINITQVLQTSSTDAQSPQGNTAAFSLTGDSEQTFTKSFTEHTIIIGLLAIRQDHTYQQGLERGWSRRRRFDYYWPSFAHLSEQPILMKEIYAQGTADDNTVFGYQERYAEYRYKPNRTSGEMRSTYSAPLDAWHYGDFYEESPILSTEFLQETPEFIDRTLAVTSTVQDQFKIDFLASITAVRPMPVYGVPGLVDHF